MQSTFRCPNTSSSVRTGSLELHKRWDVSQNNLAWARAECNFYRQLIGLLETHVRAMYPFIVQFYGDFVLFRTHGSDWRNTSMFYEVLGCNVSRIHLIVILNLGSFKKVFHIRISQTINVLATKLSKLFVYKAMICSLVWLENSSPL